MTVRRSHALRHLFSSNGFRGPVLTLLSGTTVVLALSYLIQPILTRLYTPDAFGVADYFIAIMTVLVSFASLRYEDALMLPEDERDAAGVVGLTLTVLCAFALLLVVGTFGRYAFAEWVRMPGVAPWLVLAPPTLLVMRGSRVFELWMIRKRRFRSVTTSQIAGAIAGSATRIGTGLPPVNAGAGGLIGGFALGQALAAVILAWSAVRRGALRLADAFHPRRMVTLARRYRRFPLYSTPSTVLGSLVARLPVFLLPVYFDETVVGLFGRAFVVLAVPLSLVGEAISRVFFVHAAEAHRDGNLSTVSATVHRRLVMLGLFPSLALVLAGPDLFEVVLGVAWRPAGAYAQVLAPWLFVTSVASPLTRLFDVLERQRLDLLTSLLMFGALASAFVVGGRTGDVTTTLAWVAGAGTVVRLLQLGILLRLGGVPAGEALRAYGRYVVFLLPGMLLLGGSVLLERPWLTTGASLLAGLSYAGLVLKYDRLLAPRPDDTPGDASA